MACDHLDKKTWDAAMEQIRAQYYQIHQTFCNGFKDAMNQYYDAWQSKKGFDRFNKFYDKVARSLNSASEKIVNNYNTMRVGGQEYARSQDMFVNIENINKRTFEMNIQNFDDDREIIVDEAKITAAGEKARIILSQINNYLDSSKDVTSSDQRFGYYSDGGVNPRASIHMAYDMLEGALRTATADFAKDLQKDIEEDKAMRDARKQESAVEASDLSSIF